ncbi:MAG: adenosylcobinamide-phosphate synthase CbiB [Pseudomonadota bacterium]
MSTATLMLLAWAFEAAFGWPDSLYRAIRHPVVWMGALISASERALNRVRWPHEVRYAAGLFTTLLVVGVSVAAAMMITHILPANPLGIGLGVFAASSLIASRSLYTHVAAVSDPLVQNQLCDARTAVAMIVGRDPDRLDTSGVARASLESLAENASDGVVAPIFWGTVLGLPGLAGYKAINTLDSMIGHKTDRYAAFGGFAARLDDVANLIPSRLTAVLIAVASLKPAAFKVMVRDARNHRSPNAGWPEAGIAGALGVRLSGPRTYEDETSDDAWLNSEARDPAARDLQDGLKLYIRAMVIGAACLGLIALWTSP